MFFSRACAEATNPARQHRAHQAARRLRPRAARLLGLGLVDVLHQHALVLEHVTLHLQGRSATRAANVSVAPHVCCRRRVGLGDSAHAPSGTSRGTCACRSSSRRGTYRNACARAVSGSARSAASRRARGVHSQARNPRRAQAVPGGKRTCAAGGAAHACDASTAPSWAVAPRACPCACLVNGAGVSRAQTPQARRQSRRTGAGVAALALGLKRLGSAETRVDLCVQARATASGAAHSSCNTRRRATAWPRGLGLARIARLLRLADHEAVLHELADVLPCAGSERLSDTSERRGLRQGGRATRRSARRLASPGQCQRGRQRRAPERGGVARRASLAAAPGFRQAAAQHGRQGTHGCSPWRSHSARSGRAKSCARRRRGGSRQAAAAGAARRPSCLPGRSPAQQRSKQRGWKTGTRGVSYGL